jgi:putative DNA primase/helicase
MKTRDLVVGRWPEIFSNFGLPPVTGKRHYKGDSPCCGRKGKFRIDDREGSGSFICSCGANGNGWELLKIVTGKEYRELAKMVDRMLGVESSGIRTEKKNRLHWLETIKAKRGDIRGSIVERYLNNRGIHKIPQSIISFNRSMIVLATDNNLNPRYIHETKIKPDLSKEKPTRLYRVYPEAESPPTVCRLYNVQEVMGIAEGVETALSCAKIYKMPVWASLNSGFMKKYTFQAGVKKLVIFADNDWHGEGLAAAYECAKKNLLSNNDITEVRIRWCKTVCDFNDMLFEPSKVYEHVLIKPI